MSQDVCVGVIVVLEKVCQDEQSRLDVDKRRFNVITETQHAKKALCSDGDSRCRRMLQVVKFG